MRKPEDEQVETDPLMEREGRHDSGDAGKSTDAGGGIPSPKG
jgi:hypothetical protein